MTRNRDFLTVCWMPELICIAEGQQDPYLFTNAIRKQESGHVIRAAEEMDITAALRSSDIF